LLQRFTRRHELPLIEIRFDQAKALRVDFVDGDMNVEMIGIAMNRGKTLMNAKADRGAERLFDVGELLLTWPFASGKTHNQMIGPVTLRAGIHGLGRHDLLDGERGRVAKTVRDANGADAVPIAFLIEDVVDGALGEVEGVRQTVIQDVLAEASEVRLPRRADDPFRDQSTSLPCRQRR